GPGRGLACAAEARLTIASAAESPAGASAALSALVLAEEALLDSASSPPSPPPIEDMTKTPERSRSTPITTTCIIGLSLSFSLIRSLISSAESAPSLSAGSGFPTPAARDRKSTRLNSSHDQISYAVFRLKKKKNVP